MRVAARQSGRALSPYAVPRPASKSWHLLASRSERRAYRRVSRQRSSGPVASRCGMPKCLRQLDLAGTDSPKLPSEERSAVCFGSVAAGPFPRVAACKAAEHGRRTQCQSQLHQASQASSTKPAPARITRRAKSVAPCVEPTQRPARRRALLLSKAVEHCCRTQCLSQLYKAKRKPARITCGAKSVAPCVEPTQQ